LAERTAWLAGDAREATTAERAIAQAREAFGGIDALYHVAGGSGRAFGDGPCHEITDAGWEQTIALNQTSLFYSNRAALKAFRDQGRGGAILNMTSPLAYAPSPPYFSTHAYATAKAAVIGLTTAL